MSSRQHFASVVLTQSVLCVLVKKCRLLYSISFVSSCFIIRVDRNNRLNCSLSLSHSLVFSLQSYFFLVMVVISSSSHFSISIRNIVNHLFLHRLRLVIFFSSFFSTIILFIFILCIAFFSVLKTSIATAVADRSLLFFLLANCLLLTRILFTSNSLGNFLLEKKICQNKTM